MPFQHRWRLESAAFQQTDFQYGTYTREVCDSQAENA